MMRVAVDARCLNRPHLRGMGKALAALLPRIGKFLPVRWELYADRPDLPTHPATGFDTPIQTFECRGHRVHAWEQFALPWTAWRGGANFLHCFGTRACWWQPVPTVVTIHDDLPWQGTEPDWPHGFYLDRLLPAAYRRCAAVVTISESSRRDIARRWPRLRRKLHVIPHGIGDAYYAVRPAPLPDTLATLGIRLPYLLYVGGAIPRKRPDWAVKVFAAVNHPAARLVMAGLDRPNFDRLAEQVSPEMRSRLVFLPFVAEEDMPRLYQSAAAVLYPTRYEGFGFPALEAQAVGTPVLFSAVGSLAELQGPGAVVLPADDFAAWVEACQRLLAARGENPKPDEASRTWAKAYSWDAAASRYAEVYRQVTEPKNT